MGLNSKQVIINRDGLDWSSTQTLLQSSLHDHQISLELHRHRNLPPSSSSSSSSSTTTTTTIMRLQQNNQQQSEPLKCPRCDSINTKFCYYNNYNKSQPRHFCRACKRHWTKGGTLRNVPVGGSRKNNKRPHKKSAAAAAAASRTVTKDAMFEAQQPKISGDSISIIPKNDNNLSLGDYHQDEKTTISRILSQAVLSHPENLNIGPDLDNKSLVTTKTNTRFNFPPNQSLQFQAAAFSSSLSLISDSFQTSNVVCDYGTDEQFKFMGDQATVTSSCTVQPPWQVPAAASSGMDLPNHWNWEDIDTLVSADHIGLPWDDSHDFKL